jgi:cell division protein FtsN
MAREARGGMGVVDRLVLLLAWIATCGLVYLLGFYVGKGMQERRLGLEDRIVRLPVSSQPPAEGRRQKSENEFGFYDKLMGEHGAGRAAAPVATPPARVVTPVGPPPPPTRAATAPPAPAPARVVTAVVGPPAPPREARPTPPAPAPPPAAARPAPPPAPAPARPSPLPADVPDRVAPPPAEPAAVSAAAHPAAGGWTVLVNPTRSREEADGLQRQLRGRGYDATLVRVVRDGDTWYRVQVGRFATSEQASEVMHRLREHEGVSHVFVASE